MTTELFKKTSTFFEENGYVILKGFLDKSLSNFLYQYTLLEEKRLDFINDEYITELYKPCNRYPTKDKFIENIYGTKNETQALGDFSKYGDLVFDTILDMSTSHICKYTNLKLYPSYSYHRVYTTGTELKRHKDRPSCEISTTLCLGYDSSNLNEEYNWPIFMGPNDGKRNESGFPVYLEPGDMVVYRGCFLEHWREPLMALNHSQVFLHYTADKSLERDGRKVFGLDGTFREEQTQQLNLENVYTRDIEAEKVKIKTYKKLKIY